MRLNLLKIKALCEERGSNLAETLRGAGVSRNAYYSLARKESVVPPSLVAVADQLKVPVSDLLEEVESPVERMRSLAREARRIARKFPGADVDNIRHTLILLDEKPIERLERALRRGRQLDLR
jgi:transcriptional regulator with XRE-family HTH domain